MAGSLSGPSPSTILREYVELTLANVEKTRPAVEDLKGKVLPAIEDKLRALTAGAPQDVWKRIQFVLLMHNVLPLHKAEIEELRRALRSIRTIVIELAPKKPSEHLLAYVAKSQRKLESEAKANNGDWPSGTRDKILPSVQESVTRLAEGAPDVLKQAIKRELVDAKENQESAASYAVALQNILDCIVDQAFPSSAKEEAKRDELEPKQGSTTAGSKTSKKAQAKSGGKPKPPPGEEQDDETCDMGDDPFALMGGMGEEQEFKVTLLEQTAEQDEEACDMDDDPFAMMGGMGEEQEFKVTLLKKAPAEDEEACDMGDDPFAMMGGMGEEQEFKVTLAPAATKAPEWDGRPKLSKYLAEMIEKLEGKTGMSADVLKKKAMPDVVNGVRTRVADPCPSELRAEVGLLFNEYKVLPEYAADYTTFLAALRRILALAKEEEEEDEACGDMGDDPFALMGGMGEEQEFKVTLLEQAPAEDEETCDMGDDPFAMMGGMGEEQEFKVTLLEQPAEQDQEACDMGDDPFAMMGGMGEEQEFKVTLLEQPAAAPTQVVATAPAHAKTQPGGAFVEYLQTTVAKLEANPKIPAAELTGKAMPVIVGKIKAMTEKAPEGLRSQVKDILQECGALTNAASYAAFLAALGRIEALAQWHAASPEERKEMEKTKGKTQTKKTWGKAE